MRISIMQPYFFPYLGYFQLIAASDIFVSLDDVNFIKKGWINRNRLVFNNKAVLFSVPLENVSQNRLIRDTRVALTAFALWKDNFIKSVTAFYKKFPFFNEGMSILEAVFAQPVATISDMALASLRTCCNALHITTPIMISSTTPQAANCKKEKKLIAICKSLQADTYLNPIGGVELYSQDMFSQDGIRLQFLKPALPPYTVGKREFIPALSILDVIFACGCERTSREYLNIATILEAS